MLTTAALRMSIVLCPKYPLNTSDLSLYNNTVQGEEFVWIKFQKNNENNDTVTKRNTTIIMIHQTLEKTV